MKPLHDRTGEIWEMSWCGLSHLYLVLGADDELTVYHGKLVPAYRLFNLDIGEDDNVACWVLDEPAEPGHVSLWQRYL